MLKKKVTLKKDYGPASKNPYMDSLNYFIIGLNDEYYLTDDYDYDDTKKVREYDET